MLVRLCREEGVPLVNVVRKPEQAALLKSLGAAYVCDSSAPSFLEDLTEAIVATGATIAFDATGGGKLGGQILGCMEVALSRDAKVYSRYGSFTHKQLYIYGNLDTRPTEFQRTFGLAWGMGGWLVSIFLQRVGPEAAQKLRERVALGIKTTFASAYSAQVSLAEALKPEVIEAYARRATGAKYLIRPNG
jgi:NADPH2:quinone reductase